MKILLLLLFIVPLLSKFINQRLLGGTTPPAYANAPVIGVLSQPFTWPGSTQEEFISLTNVRYLELAGAKVIPISYTMATSDLLTLLGKINGVLFTGGGIDLVNTSTLEYHPYTVTSDTIFQYSINQTDKGDYFPIMVV